MIKIYFYELRQTVYSKFYLGLLILYLCYAWLTLNSSIIQGVGNTAPFSSWSFGFYLVQQAPLMSLAFLILQWRLVSSKAKAVRILTNATLIDSRKYLLLQYMAISTAWVLLACCVVVLGMLFLFYLFGYAVSLIALLLPTLIVLFPLLIFLMGLFWLICIKQTKRCQKITRGDLTF